MEGNTCNKAIIKLGNSLAEFEDAKLAKLVLNNVTVIAHDPEISHYLLSGCYIMYPWNGRLRPDDKIKEIMNKEKPNYPFQDQNGNPIHGFYTNTPRIYTTTTFSDSAVLVSTPKEGTIIQSFPEFNETYILTEKSLSITTKFINKSAKIQYFAYGYHPYIGLNTIQHENSIDHLTIKSNIDTHCISTIDLIPSLNEDNTTLMAENYELNLKIASKFFDDFFYKNPVGEDNPYISIQNEENRTITLTSENNYLEKDCKTIQFNYFQVFTPPRRNCIAMEPMTSPNNAFNIDFPNHLVTLQPGESAVGKFTIKIN